MTIPRILIVAGSDSSGGAGIQADIKAVTAMGGYAATAITAITVQNTLGVTGVVPVAADVVAAQMRAVLEDIGADAVKTGMLVDAAVISAVADVLADYPDIPLILDPVMMSTSGHALIDDSAVDVLIGRLLPRAALITPNLPEAARLVGALAPDETARAVAALGPKAVLVKGGHGAGDEIVDTLLAGGEISTHAFPRIVTTSTHGTGCTLASAIAARVAAGEGILAAYLTARRYLQRAIETAPGLGQGHGPVNHLARGDF